MKIRINFKTPDAVDYALEDIEDEDERENLKEFIAKWVEYGETVCIEFDSCEGTARVIP